MFGYEESNKILIFEIIPIVFKILRSTVENRERAGKYLNSEWRYNWPNVKAPN